RWPMWCWGVWRNCRNLWGRTHRQILRRGAETSDRAGGNGSRGRDCWRNAGTMIGGEAHDEPQTFFSLRLLHGLRRVLGMSASFLLPLWEKDAERSEAI